VHQEHPEKLEMVISEVYCSCKFLPL